MISLEGKFGVLFSGNDVSLALHPNLMDRIAEGIIPEQGTKEARNFLIEYLGLTKKIVDQLDKLVDEEDLTFSEAIVRQLADSNTPR